MKTVVVIVFVISVQLVHAQWSYMGLGSTKVTGLIVHSDTVYASTFDGIYKKYIFDTDTVWIPGGMQGNHVVQTILTDDRTIICVTEMDSTWRTRIYRSTDGGLTFALFDTSLSYRMAYNFLKKIAHPNGTYDTLYFVSHLRKTFDGGAHWSSMNDAEWAHFIEVDPTDHSRIIAGGEGLGLNALLWTSSDYGDSWSYADMNGFFNGENALHALAINGHDWFGVGEGVICKTTDAGDNWTQVLNIRSGPPEWHLYIFDIGFSPSDTNKLYATGDGYQTYRVPLLYSEDYGVSWDTLSFQSSHKPEIVTLAVVSMVNGDRVFLGGQGVFHYENIFTGVRERHPAISDRYSLSNNYPNPFNPITTIEFSLPCARYVTLKVFNTLGQEVASLLTQELSAGKYEINWDAAGVSSGTYFYRLTAGTFSETKKLILIR